MFVYRIFQKACFLDLHIYKCCMETNQQTTKKGYVYSRKHAGDKRVIVWHCTNVTDALLEKKYILSYN